MTQPLALVLHEKLLPGGQLVNKLQDLGYRVLPVTEAEALAVVAEREKPLIILADLEPRPEQACAAIAKLRAHSPTSHLPIIAFASVRNEAAREQARQVGANLVANDSTILAHLPQFLEQALHVE